ncbi:hypothetical protein [Nisaea sediminum]|uniref:hypothetical protein n=1 Tax=Nisaea sediminum TaxID=2775867 RepID=UPI0018663050|nr:hypothetical protein [Nisaea sediminum]
MSRFAAFLAAACALAYLGTGIFFLVDPSSAHPAGSDAYWQALAAQPVERSGFLACFGLAALFAIGVIPALGRMAGARTGDPVQWGCLLGLLGYAVTAITYFRLLGGEGRRAAAVAAGSQDVRDAILSFSISLDTQGWLIFGCVGLFLALVNGAGLVRGLLPRAVGLLGLVAALLYLVAFGGLLSGDQGLVKIAAGAGGVGVGPLWWLCIAFLIWKRSEGKA